MRRRRATQRARVTLITDRDARTQTAHRLRIMAMIGRRLPLFRRQGTIHRRSVNYLRLLSAVWCGGIYTPRTNRTSTEWCGCTSAVFTPHQANINVIGETDETCFEQMGARVIKCPLGKILLVIAITGTPPVAIAGAAGRQISQRIERLPLTA